MIAPNILSADLARLAEEADAVWDPDDEGADWLHIDVMDGHFVPDLTLGLPVVSALRSAPHVPLDCHLMIRNPDRWALGYAKSACATSRCIEALRNPVALAGELRAAGAMAGLRSSPALHWSPT